MVKDESEIVQDIVKMLPLALTTNKVKYPVKKLGRVGETEYGLLMYFLRIMYYTITNVWLDDIETNLMVINTFDKNSVENWIDWLKSKNCKNSFPLISYSMEDFSNCHPIFVLKIYASDYFLYKYYNSNDVMEGAHDMVEYHYLLLDM